MHLDNGQIRETQCLRKLSRNRDEPGGTDGGGGDAALYQLNGVVDTPRRARPSVTEPRENNVSVLREPLEYRFGSAMTCGIGRRRIGLVDGIRAGRDAARS